MNNRSTVLALIAIALGALIFFAPQIKEYVDGRAGQNQENWQDNNWQDPNWQPEVQPPVAPPTPPENQPITPEIPRSYQEALAAGRQLNKDVFLFFTADWCQYCKQMKRETMSDAKVQQALQAYVVYYVDTDKERAVASKYSVGSIPAYYVVTPSEQVKKSGKGMKNPSSFIRWLGNDDNDPFPRFPPRGG